MHDLSRLSGTTALITGASGGIGEAFARELARRGADLVLVARSGDRLEELASSLRSAHGVRALTQKLDLSEAGAARAMHEWTVEEGLEVGFLVNNAGGGVGGAAVRADPEAVAAMVRLNGNTVVDSTLRFLPGMVSRGRGAIVNVGSASAFQPTPYLAAYGGSKAMVQSFTQAVSGELAGSGVRVLAVHPGVTLSGQRSEEVLPAMARMGGERRPEQVVATAFRALGSGRTSVVDGRRYAAFTTLTQRLPNRAAVALARKMTQKVLSGL
ncbi:MULTISPECIES: SDR family NAD(P)-dependent oxidoreductase [Streptomyces]|jgi:short-subunit dehydrogenase|uniref:SDR family NAD(P)-dependent oxidoreductase n=3 Tax=Streptomyces TaxID=1883 RepID=A0A7W2DNC1_9ACTN|nr:MULTISPECIES: SDR family NAD(P)-dependent oxidoreductase [Streptomyces]MBA5220033.1 SDR family NAD(P)-dependent oxidoreductase [Streptomyces griseoaurantiacus]MCF0085074.1 NADP-dependent 3-hydroxy acid dehydrogenase YdfG [Streptomyces sp. MH192]MCF0097534.1 NADP-dependent 3-hydroxy acid dehydrogenase YdfG [Streptomyces sp. MH191]MDX3089528.1 SDR family NAD(P)-dependent oxidoreductase [Streptomyces sp. ME12-02E]MDX3332986.1 SDR family NAD(P)-dependent oxidoreductase [Streptomyces sp. ME02-69